MLQLPLLTETLTDYPQSQASDEWYTPLWLINSAREVLKEIDLDPASCDIAQQVVKAKQFYADQDNGLIKPWSGKVWLNPPFSWPLIEQFTTRLIDEYQAGDVVAAIALVNAATDTAWFHALARACTRRLDFKGRLSFWNPAKPRGSNRNGQALFYFGSEPRWFELSFAHQGVIYGEPLNQGREVR